MSSANKPIEPDLSGELLERYRLIRRLGMGGMGAVYEAQHTVLEKHFAVKLLRREMAQHEHWRKRFLREAKSASRVKHPNVIDISDFGETDEGLAFFVMELLDGEDLSSVLKREGRLSWARSQGLLLQLASALESAHTRGIIHRDIKPSNCFLVDLPGQSEQDFLKVLDFGIAKMAAGVGAETETLTSTDEVFGTVAYMSPEMAQGVTDDFRSDIYAVGVLMFRVLTGQLPFKEGNAFQILAQHVNAEPPRPRDLAPTIPEGVEHIILKALAKDPNARFQSMAEFGLALRRGGLRDSDEITLALANATPGAGIGQPTERLEPVIGQHDESRQAAPPEPTAPSAVPPQHNGYNRGSTDPSPPAGHLAPVQVEQPAPPRKLSPFAALGALVLVGVAVGIGLYGGQRLSDDNAPAVAKSVDAAPTKGNQVQDLPPTPPPETPETANAPTEHAAPPTPAEQPAEPAPPVEKDAAVDALASAAAPPSDEPPPVSPRKKTTRRPKKETEEAAPKPRTDESVVAGLKRAIASKCKADGKTVVKVEGLIANTGKIASPIVSPGGDLAQCVRKVLKSARFHPSEQMRTMKRFTVTL